jgi:hypothetical protein
MTLSTQLTFGGPTTAGSSEMAGYLAQLSREQKEYFEQPFSRAQHFDTAVQNLLSVYDKCSVVNWDGYGAHPISQETYRYAYRVLESIPSQFGMPECGAESDGHITFEWHKNPARTLSVSVNDTGELHYSALIGPAKVYGTEAFYGEFPSQLSELVQRVMRA